jgi:putative ABC transport system substrate-binding protein
MVAAVSSLVEAQQAGKKTPQIGYLGAVSSGANLVRVAAFHDALSEAGYRERENIIVEYRYTDGKPERLAILAAELVALKVDVIVSEGPSVTRRVKQATDTIPIVMTKLSRVTVLGTSTEPGNAQALRQAQLAAEAFNLQVQYIDVRDRNEIETAFQAATKQRSDAVFLLTGSIFVSQRRQIAGFAIKNRLPTISYRPDFVEDGGLISYSPSLTDLSRRPQPTWTRSSKGQSPPTCQLSSRLSLS